MMRASELLPQVDGSDPLNRALRPADVIFQGKPCKGPQADEVVVQIKSSKTDQYGRGQARSHHQSGGDLCPVEVLAALQVLQPHRWRRGVQQTRRPSSGMKLVPSWIGKVSLISSKLQH